MKKHILLFLCSMALGSLAAQTYTSTMSDDSSRLIQLKEVLIKSNSKSQLQQLINYYKFNNAATLEDIISRLPEVSLQRRGAYGMEPSIRSFSAGQINVTIDGMRIHGACTDKMDPATIYIEPLNLESVQVQTGNNGFIAGSVIGGTLNMKMAVPDFGASKNISGSVISGYQTAAQSVYEAFQLNFKSGRMAIRGTGTYRNANNYRSGGGQIVPFSQYEKINYSLSAKYQLNQFTTIKTDLLADDGWNIGYPALPMDVGYAAARLGSISLEQLKNERLLNKWQVKLYANTVHHFMDDTHRPNVLMHMDMPGKSKTLGAIFDASLKLGVKSQLQLKADGSSTFLKASMTMYQPWQLPMYMLTWPDNRKDQVGTGVVWQLKTDSASELQFATRIDFIQSSLISTAAKDQISVFGYSANNRIDFLKNISVQYSKKVNVPFKITSSISYSERIATASELYGFYLFNSNDSYDYIGNPSLKNEQAWQSEVSGIFNNKYYRFKLTTFYAHIRNYILGTINPAVSSMTIGAKGVKSYQNIPWANMASLEGSIVCRPMEFAEIASTLRYNWGAADSGEPLPYISPLKNISSFRIKYKAYSLQVESESALSQNRKSRFSGEDATAGYFLVHTRFGYVFHFKGSQFQLQSGIENLFDKQYHDHLDWGNIPRPGRNIYIQTKLIF